MRYTPTILVLVLLAGSSCRMLSPELKPGEWSNLIDNVEVAEYDFDFAEHTDGVPTEEEWAYARAQKGKWRKAMLSSLQSHFLIARAGILEERFIGHPHEKQFSGINLADWRTKWRLYRDRILARAAEKGYDAAVLAECFRTVEKNRDKDVALLPIGAYRAREGTDIVWIIVCKWEVHRMDLPLENNGYGHTRGWAIRVRDQKVLTFFTCA